MVNAACPSVSRSIPLACTVPVVSSVNVTVPSVTGSPLLVTVAVNVTSSPASDGLGDDESAVSVARVSAESIVRHQPPPIDPAVFPLPSTTNRRQSPLGLVLMNVSSVVAPDGGGAGSGHESVPWSALLGR